MHGKDTFPGPDQTADLHRIAAQRSPFGIFVVDRDNRCVYANEAGCRMSGRTAEDLLGRDLLSLLPEDLQTSGREHLDAARQTAMNGVELPFVRPDGLRRWWSIDTAPLDGGRIIAYAADVTELRRLPLEVDSDSARLRAIFDSAIDFVFMKDRDRRYTHVNRACRDFFGRPLDEIIGRLDAELFDPEDIAEIEAVDRRVLAGEVFRGVFERRVRGQTIFLETIKAPIRDDDGEVVGLCGFSRDITEVRRLEDRLRHAQKIEAIGRLAGGVAHDFNNLLTPILGYAEMLRETYDAQHPHHRDAAAIVRAAERARDLTAQLLAFGRNQFLDVRLIDLNDVVRAAEPLLRGLLRQNMRLDLRLAEPLGAVRADASLLQTVLVNLVINAVDSMPDGGAICVATRNVELDEEHARAHPGSSAGPHVLLAVSDEGCGMDGEMLNKVFEPFFTTKKVCGGAGLGLASVDGIVRQHRGSIDVRSRPGHGTVFEICLPRAVAEAGPLPQCGEDVRLHGRERILLVEDDASVRATAAAALLRYGYEVVPAATPAAALASLEEGLDPCRLLISDVVMPGMNGLELHRAIQETWPATPALFMSGYTSDVVTRQGVQTEGIGFIQKPFSPRDLAAKVREALDA